MRAAVLSQFGGPQVLQVLDNVGVPQCRPHEVLVRVAAAAVNPLDCRLRAGYGGELYRPQFPLVLGRDLSGEVVAMGSSAQNFVIGTQVFGSIPPASSQGTHAEYVAVPEAHLAEKPSNLSHEEASAISFGALAAWRALFLTGRLAKGDRVLVVGSSSSVGRAAAQLAVAKGCEVVLTRYPCKCFAVTKGKMARCVVCGEHDSKCNDNEEFGSFDVALDTVGSKHSLRHAITLLRRDSGRYITLHGRLPIHVGKNGLLWGGLGAAFDNTRMKALHCACDEIGYRWAMMRHDAHAFAEIVKLVQDGLLDAKTGWTLPLEDVSRAHVLVEGEKTGTGKVVLKLKA